MGELAITAHFSTSQSSHNKLHEEGLLMQEGIDQLAPIQTMLEALAIAGYKNIHHESIGKHVFEGYERWITQINTQTPWSHNIYQSYRKGYIDYYVITASNL